ncbi:MAG: metallophosphatase family protein [Bacteroidetes bacterium]|nr:metallophosphatase family protein [Bacteroidota bacterium]
MIKIGLLSDTHGYIHPKVFDFFKEVDEIWHAGDIGNLETAKNLASFKPLYAVYGNIDGHDLRVSLPENRIFIREGLKVLMTHIGGYPGRYAKGIKEILIREKVKLFISGHSHILKVMNDKKLNLLHVNPGAAGKNGLHNVITFTRFTIDKDRIADLEIMEIERASL